MQSRTQMPVRSRSKGLVASRGSGVCSCDIFPVAAKVGAFCMSGHFSLSDNIASHHLFNKLLVLHTLCSGSRSRLDLLKTSHGRSKPA